jgi:hypothetical protein
MTDDPVPTIRRLERGDIEIAFRSTDGDDVALRLSHAAAARLREMLPAAPVGRREGDAFALAMKPRRVVGFTAFTWAPSLAALELRLSEREAMHVCFDAEAGEQLVDALQWLATNLPDGSGAGTHH